MLQWFAWMRRQCAAEKKILRLNLDETSIKLFVPCGRGHIARLDKREGRRLRQPASRRQMRMSVTFVAIICDEPNIQVHLPQIILGGERVLPQSILREVRPSLRSNVSVLRTTNGWMTAGLMARLMTVLGKSLEPITKTYQPIMLFDAFSAHLSPRVFRAAARAHIWTVVIPAKMTGLLQPLDTHVFYRLKMYLRYRYLEKAAQTATGRVPLQHMIMAVNDAVRFILQKYTWSRAFESNGFSLHGGPLRDRIREAMGCSDSCQWHNDRPLSLRQFQDIWPAGKHIPFADVFAWTTDSRERQATRPAGPSVSEEDDAQATWLERLRPRTPQGAEAASSSWQRPRTSSRPPGTTAPLAPPPRVKSVPRPIAKSRPSPGRSAVTAAQEMSGTH